LFLVRDPDELFTSEDKEPYVVESDRMTLDETEKGRISHLIGNLKITHGNTIITGDEGFVYEEEKMAKIVKNVKVDDEGTIITSGTAQYYRMERKAVLYDSVKLLDGDQILNADSLTYFKEKKLSIASGNVILIDLEQNTEVTGDYGEYSFITEEGFITKDPQLMLTENEKQIRIRGDTIRIKRKENFISCKGNVTVVEDSITARAGYMEYHSDSEWIHLEYEPVVEQEGKSTLSGMSIDVFLKKKEIVKAIAILDAKGNYFFSDGGTNDVMGDTITVYFKDGEAERITVEGNAHGIFKDIKEKAGESEEEEHVEEEDKHVEEEEKSEDEESDEESEEEGKNE
jgi:lipopolysaccharide transport protein LptA